MSTENSLVGSEETLVESEELDMHDSSILKGNGRDTNHSSCQKDMDSQKENLEWMNKEQSKMKGELKINEKDKFDLFLCLLSFQLKPLE